MDASALLIAVLALVAGACAGWVFARHRAEQDARQSAAETARLATVLDVERAASRDRDAARTRDEQQLREAFGSLAGEALSRNSEAFVALAEARLATARTAADGDLAHRQQAIEGMVAPLRESLDRVQDQLRAVERERVGSYATLLEQIGTMRQTSEQLRTETAQLVTALRAPQVRGRWGELQLERAVEAAGMTEHIDYVTQVTATGEDGTVRPDLVVRLVGGKNVVVDAKVAFSGYLEAMEARDEVTRATRLKAHARHLRVHIESLGAKAYWERFAPSPEFVVCFVPADAFLDAALREEPGLLELAFSRNVVIATPSTLIALLRTVAYTWRQEALAANAAEVHHLGRELYQRIAVIGQHLDRLGKSIGDAVGNYNKTVTSLESRVLSTARKMVDLKVVDPADAVSSPRQLTETVRLAQAPELTEHRVVSLQKRVAVAQDELPGAAPEATGA